MESNELMRINLLLLCLGRQLLQATSGAGGEGETEYRKQEL